MPNMNALTNLSKLNQRGLSLVEVMIVVVAFAFLNLAAISWIRMLNRESEASNEGASISSTMTKVRAAFGDDDILCTKILKNQALTATTGSSVPMINYYDKDPANPNPVGQAIAAGHVTDPQTGIMVLSILLKPITAVGATTVIANLEVTFAKELRSSVLVVRKIPLQAFIASGKIVSCSMAMSSKVVMNTKICEVLHDGFYFFDAATDECKPSPQVKTFTGLTPFEAKCPAGYRPAASKLNLNSAAVACSATSLPGAILPPRTYLSGFVDKSRSLGYVSSLDYQAATCTFVYEVGVSTSGNQTRILCVESSVP